MNFELRSVIVNVSILDSSVRVKKFDGLPNFEDCRASFSHRAPGPFFDSSADGEDCEGGCSLEPTCIPVDIEPRVTMTISTGSTVISSSFPLSSVTISEIVVGSLSGYDLRSVTVAWNRKSTPWSFRYLVMGTIKDS